MLGRASRTLRDFAGDAHLQRVDGAGELGDAAEQGGHDLVWLERDRRGTAQQRPRRSDRAGKIDEREVAPLDPALLRRRHRRLSPSSRPRRCQPCPPSNICWEQSIDGH
jgi:hypothetical protein